VSEGVLGRGGESCWRGQQCRALWRTRRVRDGKLHHRECNLLYFTRFGVILTGGTPRLGIPASQWHGEVLPPCHCGARIASMQYKCDAFNAKGGNFGEKLFDKIGEDGRSVCHLSGSGFWSPSTSFGEKTRGTFFVLHVAREVFFQCSPYHESAP